MQSVRRYPLPPRYRDLLRDGPKATETPKRLRTQLNGFGEEYPGTAGWSHHSKPGIVLLLAQIMVQQRWTDGEVRAELMKPFNKGGLWLRRHDDPDAALGSMLARVQRGRRPWLEMKERHRRIEAALITGEVLYQRELMRVVDHPDEGEMRRDFQRLTDSGAIVMIPEVHGKRTWWRISIGAGRQLFWDLASAIRREIGRRIGVTKIHSRSRETVRLSKVCVSLPKGEPPQAGGVVREPAFPSKDQKTRPSPFAKWKAMVASRRAAEAERLRQELHDAYADPRVVADDTLLLVEPARLTLTEMAGHVGGLGRVRPRRRPSLVACDQAVSPS